jgi:hypothetical protein
MQPCGVGVESTLAVGHSDKASMHPWKHPGFLWVSEAIPVLWDMQHADTLRRWHAFRSGGEELWRLWFLVDAVDDRLP